MKKCKIVSVKPLGIRQAFNVTMKSSQHNYTINDPTSQTCVISRNSHAAAYAYESYKTAYLKAHFPLEFFAGYMSIESDRRKFDIVAELEKDATTNFGVRFLAPDLDRSKLHYRILGEREILRPLAIKGVGEKAAADIIANQPYPGPDKLYSFATKVGSTVNTKVVEALYDEGLFGTSKTKAKVVKDFEQIRQDKKKRRGRPDGDLF